ncbi:MAG: hypothetical protein HY717_23480 [Planctomycetes bacterium]|nr:hypothetical protein [Planctomycetota bacterium]
MLIQARGFGLNFDRLSSSGDRICLRDPRGRGPRPGLLPERHRGCLELRAAGPFVAIQRYTVTPEEGRLFTRACRDDNSIHSLGNVIPGAMTAARILLLPEVLFAGGSVQSLRFRFRALARYGAVLTNLYQFQPSGSEKGFEATINTWQEGVHVAEGRIRLKIPEAEVPPGLASLPAAHPERTALTLFFHSLRFEAEAFFELAGLVYPCAYLAALPSGEMVRSFSGEGGLLNSLELEFPQKLPIVSAAPPPVVQVQRSSKVRLAFTKVWTCLLSGLETIGKGFAMVLPGAATPGEQKPSPA